MKLFLTSSGISNPNIENALVDLLCKPISESSALIVATAIYPFAEVGGKSRGVLEPTALRTIKRESWVPQLQETDALLVWGGHVMYLCYWMRQSGFCAILALLFSPA